MSPLFPRNIISSSTGILVFCESASANFKAEGLAGAEVSTSAVAVLKGSLVQIN